MGVPTATLNTTLFAGPGQRLAKSLGYPYLPIITFPHPVGFSTDEQLAAVVRGGIDEIVHVLTTPRLELEREYRNKYIKEMHGRQVVRSSEAV